MNINDLRTEFEIEASAILGLSKDTLRLLRNGNYYDRGYIDDAWKDYQKEANQAEKMQMVQRDV